MWTLSRKRSDSQPPTPQHLTRECAQPSIELDDANCRVLALEGVKVTLETERQRLQDEVVQLHHEVAKRDGLVETLQAENKAVESAYVKLKKEHRTVRKEVEKLRLLVDRQQRDLLDAKKSLSLAQYTADTMKSKAEAVVLEQKQTVSELNSARHRLDRSDVVYGKLRRASIDPTELEDSASELAAATITILREKIATPTSSPISGRKRPMKEKKNNNNNSEEDEEEEEDLVDNDEALAMMAHQLITGERVDSKEVQRIMLEMGFDSALAQGAAIGLGFCNVSETENHDVTKLNVAVSQLAKAIGIEAKVDPKAIARLTAAVTPMLSGKKGKTSTIGNLHRIVTSVMKDEINFEQLGELGLDPSSLSVLAAGMLSDDKTDMVEELAKIAASSNVVDVLGSALPNSP
eukprot:m.22441 g.22441  ORF g.22441 m.22441 type:complete len:406 (-) comp13815_c0_seq1:116-1333(-)